MQPLDLNLASRPFRNNTVPWVGLVVAICLLIGTGVWNWRSYQENTVLLADLQQRISAISSTEEEMATRERVARREIEKFDLDLIAMRADKANEVIRWKAFSWTRLFNQLQDVLPWNTQMTSIHPAFRADRRAGSSQAVAEDPERVPVAVDGVAKTLDDFLEFEDALFADPHFDRVQPGRTDIDPNSGELLFSVSFLYDPRVGEQPPAAAGDEPPAETPPPAEGEEDTPDAEQVAEQVAEVREVDR